jgi:hypothetical protein
MKYVQNQIYTPTPKTPNYYPLCRPLYALGSDACLHGGQAKLKLPLTSLLHSLNEDVLDFFFKLCLFESASQLHHYWIFLLLPEKTTETQDTDFCSCLPLGFDKIVILIFTH